MPSWITRVKNLSKQSQNEDSYIDDIYERQSPDAEDYYALHDSDDLRDLGDKEAWEDAQSEAQADKYPDIDPDFSNNPESYYTVEPEDDGTFRVVEHGTYERGSVLEGKPKDAVVGFFDTIEEAQQEFPQAEISEGRSTPRFTADDAMNMPEPPDFDPLDAGETW